VLGGAWWCEQAPGADALRIVLRAATAPTTSSWTLASSSRSQVQTRITSAAERPTWDGLSVDVRWRPLLAVVIVTHLVTRLRAFIQATRLQAATYLT
jgi:hypothetical protein